MVIVEVRQPLLVCHSLTLFLIQHVYCRANACLQVSFPRVRWGDHTLTRPERAQVRTMKDYRFRRGLHIPRRSTAHATLLNRSPSVFQQPTLFAAEHGFPALVALRLPL